MSNGTIWETLLKYLPIIIPLIVIQIGLMIVAVVDLIKREKTRGPKWVWFIVIIFVNLIGPIVYFVVGREDE
jgi:hypothetical protein